MEENDLWGQLYNVDETGMPLDPPKLRVCARKGQKKVRQRGSGNKSQITVVSCGSATGHVIPPFVIFEGKNFNHQWSECEVPGTMYVTSGLILNYSSTGLLTTFFDMPLQHAHFCYSWMGTVLTISQKFYGRQRKMVWRCFVFLPIRQPTANL